MRIFENSKIKCVPEYWNDLKLKHLLFMFTLFSDLLGMAVRVMWMNQECGKVIYKTIVVKERTLVYRRISCEIRFGKNKWVQIIEQERKGILFNLIKQCG